MIDFTKIDLDGLTKEAVERTKSITKDLSLEPAGAQAIFSQVLGFLIDRAISELAKPSAIAPVGIMSGGPVSH